MKAAPTAYEEGGIRVDLGLWPIPDRFWVSPQVAERHRTGWVDARFPDLLGQERQRVVDTLEWRHDVALQWMIDNGYLTEGEYE